MFGIQVTFYKFKTVYSTPIGRNAASSFGEQQVRLSAIFENFCILSPFRSIKLPMQETIPNLLGFADALQLHSC